VQVHVPSVFRVAERQVTHPVLICLLGSFQVLTNGRPVTLRGGGKGEALLSALATRVHQGASRDRIIDSLWPDTDSALAGQSLNTLVYSLHRMMGDALNGAPPVIYSGGWYRLNVDAGVAVDIAEFDALVDSAHWQSSVDALLADLPKFQSNVSLMMNGLIDE